MAITPFISTAGGAVGEPPRAVRGSSSCALCGGEELGPDEGCAVAVAFGVLLDATRAGLTAPRHRPAQAAPARMFEPGGDDAPARRLADLKARSRAESLSPPRDERLDTTSVEARRSAQARRDPVPADFRGGGTHTVAHGGKAGAKASVSGMEVGGRVGISHTSTTEKDFRAEPIKTALDTGEPRPTSSTRVGDGTASPAAQCAVPSMTPVAAPLPTTAMTQSADPAPQVGKLLSTGNTPEVDSARAVTSSPAADGPRSPAAQSKTAHGSSSGRGGQTRQSSRQAGGTDASKPSEFERLVRSIRLQTGAKNSTARMRLEPPELGRVRVDVRMAGDQVQIDVRAETDQAREVLHDRAVHLRAALEQHGIQVERLTVTADTVNHDPGSPPENEGFEAADRQAEQQGPGGPGPEDLGESDVAGPSDPVEVEPEALADAEARLDIRI